MYCISKDVVHLSPLVWRYGGNDKGYITVWWESLIARGPPGSKKEQGGGDDRPAPIAGGWSLDVAKDSRTHVRGKEQRTQMEQIYFKPQVGSVRLCA